MDKVSVDLTNQDICTDRIEKFADRLVTITRRWCVVQGLSTPQKTRWLYWSYGLWLPYPLRRHEVSEGTCCMRWDRLSVWRWETLINKVTYFTHLHSARKEIKSVATRTTVTLWCAYSQHRIGEVYQKLWMLFRETDPYPVSKSSLLMDNHYQLKLVSASKGQKKQAVYRRAIWRLPD